MILRVPLAALLALASLPALAQAPAEPPPAAPPAAAVPARRAAPLSLSAVLPSDPRPLRSGLVWRVYAEDAAGALTLAAQSREPAPTLSVAPGSYFVHAAYGLAGATRRVEVRAEGATERMTLNAGALRLSGVVGSTPIAPGRSSFAIFIPIGSNSEGRLVASNLRAGEIVRLPEGSYHVVSNYGATNAIQRADVRVEAGRLIDATLNHRAAVVTLKLVQRPGAEAIAGTNFTVLTPGGDVIREIIGAFPSLVLAEGTYTLIARNDGRVFPAREFEVKTGQDADVEVVAQ